MQILVSTTSAHDTDAAFALLRFDQEVAEAAIADAEEALKALFKKHGGHGSLIMRGGVDVVVLKELPPELVSYENQKGDTCVRLPDDFDRMAQCDDLGAVAMPTEIDGIQVWGGYGRPLSVRLCTYLRHTPIVIDSADFSGLLDKDAS
jgi:hypothetical protein